MTKRVELSLSAEECGIGDTDCVFKEPVQVSAELTNINGIIRAKGFVRTGYETFCARCLKPVYCSIEKPFDEEYVGAGSLRGTRSDEAEVYEYSDKEIDISLAARDAVLLEIPIRHLCGEDCKSLCPVCGKDLNEGDCDCELRPADARFEVLKDYYL
ncbi:MAG: DUF177 domain-containing protein [Clostridiales bacterium]|nr:DUF177 domain-containing protein [Clostridiales bacterium]